MAQACAHGLRLTLHISLAFTERDLLLVPSVPAIARSLGGVARGCFAELLLTVDPTSKSPGALEEATTSTVGRALLRRLQPAVEEAAAALGGDPGRPAVRQVLVDYASPAVRSLALGQVLGIPSREHGLALEHVQKHTVMHAYAAALCETEYLLHYDVDSSLPLGGAGWLLPALARLRNASRYPGLFAVNLEACDDVGYYPPGLHRLVPLPGQSPTGLRSRPRAGFYIRYHAYSQGNAMQGPVFSMQHFLMHVPRFRALWPLLADACALPDAGKRLQMPQCTHDRTRLWQENIEALIELRLLKVTPFPSFAAVLGPGSVDGACRCEVDMAHPECPFHPVRWRLRQHAGTHELAEAAVVQGQQLAASVPEHPEVWLCLGAAAAVSSVERDWHRWVWVGEPQVSPELAATAREALLAAVRLRPGWPRAHALLAVICHAWPPRDSGCAERHASRALALYPQEELALLVAAAATADAMPVVNNCTGTCSAPIGWGWPGHLSTSDDPVLAQHRELRRGQVEGFLRDALELAPERAETRAALGMQLQGSAEAVELLRSAVTLAPSSRPLMDAAVRALQDARRSAEAEELLRAATATGLWRVPYQRPTNVFWRQLPVAPFPESPELLAAAAVFQGSWDRVQVEARGLHRGRLAFFNGFAPCSARSTCREENAGLLPPRRSYAGRWEEGHLYSAEGGLGDGWQASSCSTAAAPVTCATLAEAAKTSGLQLLRASISRVHGPRTRIPWHGSAAQGRLRLHCPLEVPPGAASLLRLGGGVSRAHEEGHCFWFDESVEHELVYTAPPGSPPRVLLMVDAAHPGIAVSGEPDLAVAPFTAGYWAAEHLAPELRGQVCAEALAR